jgi:hypothetical protein
MPSADVRVHPAGRLIPIDVRYVFRLTVPRLGVQRQAMLYALFPAAPTMAFPLSLMP